MLYNATKSEKYTLRVTVQHRRVSMNDKERRIFVLQLTVACLEYAEENNKSFEEVLHEDVFPNKASVSFSEMVCNTLKELADKKYISGTVTLVHDFEMDPVTFEEKPLENLFISECTFENIKITMLGKTTLKMDDIKEQGKEYWQNCQPYIAEIGSDVIGNVLSAMIISGLKALGIPVNA